MLHEERMLEASKETTKSHVFKIENWFVFAGNKNVRETMKCLRDTLSNEETTEGTIQGCNE